MQASSNQNLFVNVRVKQLGFFFIRIKLQLLELDYLKNRGKI